MHSDFAEWYRMAGLTPNSDELPKRWIGVETYAPGKHEIAALTRYFYRLGKPSTEFLTGFRGAFQKADAAFQMRDNDQELAVLAGAVLTHVMGTASHHLADLAALALLSASAQNLRPSPAVRDIPRIAVDYLKDRAVTRASAHANAAAIEPLVAALTKVGPPHDQLAQELLRLQQDSSLLLVVAEESNMLWWLLAEHSRDCNKRWPEFPFASVALMAGKELADLTRVLPGPLAATALLDRVIRSAKSNPPLSVLITDAIDGLGVEWKERYASESYPTELEDLLPVSHGLKLSLASAENNAWFPAFTKGAVIEAGAKLVPYALAFQMFLEVLVRRAWNALN